MNGRIITGTMTRVTSAQTALTHPPYWLVLGLEWPAEVPSTQPAECALAIAPTTIPRRVMSFAADMVFEVSAEAVEHEPRRVVMFSELTQFLQAQRLTWPEVQVDDWEATVDEIVAAPALGTYLALDSYSHVLLCTAGHSSTVVNGEQVPASRYEGLRANLTRVLEQEWPDYVRGSDTFRSPP